MPLSRIRERGKRFVVQHRLLFFFWLNARLFDTYGEAEDFVGCEEVIRQYLRNSRERERAIWRDQQAWYKQQKKSAGV